MHCEPPSHLGLTWELDADVSWVEARLCNDGTGRSRLSITHTALLSDQWHKFGPGAVGVGWEMGLLGMELHLARPNEPKLDATTFHTTRDGRALLVGSSAAWGRAAEAAGTDPDVARAAAQRTKAFYTGDAARAGVMHVFDVLRDPERCGAVVGALSVVGVDSPSRRR